MGRRLLSVAAERRDALVAIVSGCALVALPGFATGGFSPRAWTWLTLVLASGAGISLVLRGRPRLERAEGVLLVSLAALTIWTALSREWAVAGSAVADETRRTLLYLVALAALLVLVRAEAVRPLLEGVAFASFVLALWALGGRILHPHPAPDPFEGTLLVGSIGYSNALGIVVAIGALLALGLAATEVRRLVRRLLRAGAVLLLATLSLTASRGAWLALLVGLVWGLLLARREVRGGMLAQLAVIAPVGAAAGALVQHSSGSALAGVAVGAAAAAALLPPPRRHRRAAGLALVALALCGGAIGVALHGVEVGSSYRSDYWSVALEDAHRHPLLGSGAGSFAAVWLRDRPVPVNVTDAHSLYLESLAELGPVGLLLVLALPLLPLLRAVRARSQPLIGATAGVFAAFVVHVGLDWDWEMPVVVLMGLAVAVALLRAPSGERLLDDAPASRPSEREAAEALPGPRARAEALKNVSASR